MSQYPVPPPSYGASGVSKPTEPESEPLLSPRPLSPTGSAQASGSAFYDQPAAGDLPDDFKVGRIHTYTTCLVIDCSFLEVWNNRL